MSPFLALIARSLTLATRVDPLVPARRADRGSAGIANDLLESADARAGHDPRHAHELREATHAYLRVLR